MKTALSPEWAEVLTAALAKQGSLAATQLQGKDPIAGAITTKNVNRPQASAFLGYLLGTYDTVAKTFTAMVVTVGGVDYVVGNALDVNIASAGTTQTFALSSYAIDVSAAVNLDAFCFALDRGGYSVTYLMADYGLGSRVIGIKKSDFEAIKANIFANAVFTGVLSISPAPAGPSVQITALILNKGS